MIFILFGILIFVFIFFFGPQSQGVQGGREIVDPSGWAARINGEVVTQREVTLGVRRQMMFYRRDNGPALKRDVLGQLVDLRLIEQRARKAGITASDEEVDAFIVSRRNSDAPLFYTAEGRFDAENFDSQLTQLGANSEQYREAKRIELIVQRYIAMLSSQVKVTEVEAREQFDRSKRTWTLEYIAVDPSTVEATDATAEEGAAFAKANPEKIKAFYDSRLKDYKRGKEIRLRRILVKQPKDDAGKAAARKKIDGLLAQARAEGADFAALASEHSEGFYKKNGGDMGWQSKENSAKSDYEVFAALEKGAISDVRENLAGLWIVKAEDIKPAVDRTLEQVTAEIGVKLAKGDRQKAAAMVEAKALLAAAKTAKTLAEAIPAAAEGEAVKYAVKTTSAIRQDRLASNRIPGIGESEALAQRLTTLTEASPLINDVLEINDALYVVRLKERTEPKADEFAKEKDALIQRIMGARMQALFGQWQQLLFGPASRRDQMKQFGGGALFAELYTGADTAINEAIFPAPAADESAKK